jgi:hypothetical protein
MKHSIRYVQIKFKIDHDDDADPEDIINENIYKFNAESKIGTIREIHLLEISETPLAGDTPVTKKQNKKVVDAIFEIENAINDAIANRDETVVLDPKVVQTVVDCAKARVLEAK